MTCNTSDISPAFPALVDSSSGLAKPAKTIMPGRIIELTGIRFRTSNQVYHCQGLAPCLTRRSAPFVWVTAKSTSMPLKSISNTSPIIETSATSPKSIRKKYRSLISCAVAFLANPFHLQENDKNSAISAVRSSLKSLGLLNKGNHAFYCLKTSKGFYLTTKERRFLPFSRLLMNWGMMLNGKCLTARISAFPKTGNGY